MNMTKTEKRRFIRDLTRRLLNRAIEGVDRMPANWDGIELRQYLADIYAESVCHAVSSSMKRRLRDYRNEMIVRNL